MSASTSNPPVPLDVPPQEHPKTTPLKRKRSDCSLSQPDAGPLKRKLQAPTRGSRIRDDTYYFDDGSCIILVQNTLFNVHRTILSKDSSSFQAMFSLPQGSDLEEGRSDENPIVLTGDTVNEFRHFFWALYALPPELSVIHSADANLAQLMDITRIANKYSFKGMETWTLDAIQEYVNRKPSPILTAIPPPNAYTFSPSSASAPATSSAESTAQLTRLIRLAQMCNHEKLLSTMILLLRQLMSSSVQYAYLAMTLADELDLRVLRGAAYLEVMQKAVIVKRASVDRLLKPKTNTSTVAPTVGPPGLNLGLGASATSASTTSSSTTAALHEGDVDDEGRLVINSAQQLRLLAGYYRLTRTWEHLRTNPPRFEHAPACGATWHQNGCTSSWLDFWKDKTRSDQVLALGMADVLGRLKQLQRDHERWGSATYMHGECRLAARRSIAETIKAVEEALPDFFYDDPD